ncbi:hypothetical protein CB1_000872001 [Camelus ferus]|nr:hypothetical protein CB1_000872001 [Camelus ferus]
MNSGGGFGLGLGFGLTPTAVIQVTNLSSAVTSEQMRTLFSFLGEIEELRLYPPDNAPLAFSSKVCYVKFRDPSSVGVAQHLTNTVFIDRALIVVPCAEGKIPEESKALSLLAPAPTMTSLMPGAGLLPIPTPNPLTTTTTADQLLEFFKQVGEVKFVRMAGDETQPTRFAFVEFADQNSVPRALAFNGVMFGDRPLKINHSNNAIVKPPEMTPQAAAKELEEVMKRVREAQSFISAAIEPVAPVAAVAAAYYFLGGRNKKDKKREKERDHISERRERERSTSTRKSSNDRDGKEKVEKNNTSLKEKEHNKEPDSGMGKEVEDKDAPRTEENKVQQNGNCQPNDENLSTKTEAV